MFVMSRMRLLFAPDEPASGEPAGEPAEPTKEPTTPPEPAKSGEPAADETVTLTKAQHEALNRKVAEAEKLRRKTEKDAQDAEKKRLEDEGKWQERAETADKRAETAEAKLKERDQRDSLVDVAKGLKFRNPTIAVTLLPSSVDREDQEAVKAAFEHLATSEPYLVDNGSAPPPPRTGAPAPGGKTDDLTADDIRRMTTQQVAALTPAQVEKALART